LSEYGISYGTKDEFNYRFQNYLKADKAINEINADPELTFVSEHNMFSVLSPSEMKLWKGKKPADFDFSDIFNEIEFLPTDVMAA